MKSELRLRPHSILEGAMVIEIWYEGRFIGQVTGKDGGGVRVISKHPMDVARVADFIEVSIKG